MVKYYGRARQQTGFSTNQIGLNMSGSVSSVGRSGALAGYVKARSQSNVKFCGDVYYRGKLWATNRGRCVPKAPRTQSFNSGVGHRALPAFKCGANYTSDKVGLSPSDKLKYLRDHFAKSHPNYMLCLIGENETIDKDLDKITHEKFIRATNTNDYKSNVKIMNYVNSLNMISKWKIGRLVVTKNTDTEYHILGLCPLDAIRDLLKVERHDVPLGFGRGVFLDTQDRGPIIAFGAGDGDPCIEWAVCVLMPFLVNNIICAAGLAKCCANFPFDTSFFSCRLAKTFNLSDF